MPKLTGFIKVEELESPVLPEGCVAFIHLMQEDKVVGHQTLSKLTHFPFEFSLDLIDEPVREDVDYSLRVTVEQGESILWANSGISIAKGPLPETVVIVLKELRN
jgi:hypothetical protein